MITCSSSSKGLYACLFMVKDGKLHLFSHKERWYSNYTHKQQENGFLARAQVVIIEQAIKAGLRQRDVMNAHFYPDLDTKRSKERRL